MAANTIFGEEESDQENDFEGLQQKSWLELEQDYLEIKSKMMTLYLFDEYSLESEDSSTEEEEAEDAIVNNDHCTQQPRTRGRKNNGSAQNQDRIWTEKLR